MKKTAAISFIIILAAVFLLLINPFSNPSDNSVIPIEPESDFGFKILEDEETIMSNIETAPFRDNIIDVTSQKDSIPPIDTPQYQSIEDADSYLTDRDKVFIYEAEEGIFIYPQRILVWHEIVNEFIDGEWISITYCPLTGSTVCYSGNEGIHTNNNYGTSGRLLNSNLVMYDRATDSFIPQILGTGVSGDMDGVVLDTRPIHWADWIDAKAAHPSAKVLTTDTGYIRDYDRDPYGTYDPGDTNSYYVSGESMFNTMHVNDGTFESKKVVIGVKHGENVLALDPDLVMKNKALAFTIGTAKGVALYDEQIKAVRIFHSRFEGTDLNLIYDDGIIFDQMNRTWTSRGISESGTLEEMTYFDVMWFAWYAYYPETEVIR